MTDVAQRLKVKFGLPTIPTETEIREFHRMLRYLIALGRGDIEDKGQKAAVSAFKGVGTVLQESEADSIEMLLKMIEAK